MDQAIQFMTSIGEISPHFDFQCVTLRIRADAFPLNTRDRDPLDTITTAFLIRRRVYWVPSSRTRNFMQYRQLGRTGWAVSDIGYGLWGMSGWSGSDDEQSLASLQRAVDAGCTFLDSAWGYGEGK